MKREDWCIVVVFALLVSLMAALTFTSPYPNGRDVWFHILVARAWRKGQDGMVSPIVMWMNGVPYPPLFHFLLLPFVGSLDTALLWAKILQLVFYPVSVLLLTLLVRKYTNSKTALVFSLALIGTYFAFSETQTKPESLAMTLYPVAFWALLERKTKLFIAINVLMFWIYSPYSLAISLGFFVYLLRQEWKDQKIWVTAMFSSPIVVFQFLYIFLNIAFLERWIKRGDLGVIQETTQFLNNPAIFVLNSFGLTTIAFILIPYTIYKWKCQSELTKVFLYSFIGMLIVWPVWLQRTFSLVAVPMAYFTALYLLKVKNKYVRAGLICLFAVQAICFSLSPVWWMSRPPYLNEYW